MADLRPFINYGTHACRTVFGDELLGHRLAGVAVLHGDSASKVYEATTRSCWAVTSATKRKNEVPMLLKRPLAKTLPCGRWNAKGTPRQHGMQTQTAQNVCPELGFKSYAPLNQ
jgi:hypothetical protein